MWVANASLLDAVRWGIFNPAPNYIVAANHVWRSIWSKADAIAECLIHSFNFSLYQVKDYRACNLFGTKGTSPMNPTAVLIFSALKYLRRMLKCLWTDIILVDSSIIDLNLYFEGLISTLPSGKVTIHFVIIQKIYFYAILTTTIRFATLSTTNDYVLQMFDCIDRSVASNRQC